MKRRQFLIASALPLLTSCATMSGPGLNSGALPASLALLEEQGDVRIGLAAINTRDNTSFSYRGDERFAFCSTFKFILAAAILRRSVQSPELMQQRVNFTAGEIRQAGFAPISREHIGAGMSVAELCAAAIGYSDNGAANALLKIIGGPDALTAFAASLGDADFRLDRWEPELNSAIPGDMRDTTTPKAMAGTMRRLALDDGLPPAQRIQLQDWLKANTTGDERIRAGVSGDWQVGDKTGTGDYGVANDVAVLWPRQLNRAPVVLAIFTNQMTQQAKANSAVVASAARLVMEAMESETSLQEKIWKRK